MIVGTTTTISLSLSLSLSLSSKDVIFQDRDVIAHARARELPRNFVLPSLFCVGEREKRGLVSFSLSLASTHARATESLTQIHREMDWDVLTSFFYFFNSFLNIFFLIFHLISPNLFRKNWVIFLFLCKWHRWRLTRGNQSGIRQLNPFSLNLGRFFLQVFFFFVRNEE